jgi:pyruvate-formate lyase-activating enzyme
LKAPLILEIKGNSLDDGPGIRSVVFFKGCPLSCFWCHNPESKRPGLEIAYDATECIACNTCLDHFDLLKEKRVGETINMLDIVTAMQLADKAITI